MTEMKVNLPAQEVWAVFRSLNFAKILLKLSPEYFKAIEYVRGYGGEGTLLNITLQPGEIGDLLLLETCSPNVNRFLFLFQHLAVQTG